MGHYANNCPDASKKARTDTTTTTVAKVEESKEVFSKEQIDEKIAAGVNAVLEARKKAEDEKAAQAERLAKVVDNVLRKHNLI